MRRLVLRRVLRSVPLLIVVTATTFVLESLVPGNAARTLAGISATHAQYEALRKQLGLNLPLWDQYGRYVWNVLHGNLGIDPFNGESTGKILDQRIWVTLSLVSLTTLFCAVVGVLLGVASAVREGWSARFVDAVSIMGLALPGFLVAIILVTLLAVRIRLFPATGYVYFTASPMNWFRSLVLPVAALAIGPTAIVAKQARDAMKDTLASDYVRTLRAGGLSQTRILAVHALRNASIPVLTVLGLVFVGALGASVFVEQVFVLPGLGSLAVNATAKHNVPVLEGVTLYFTLFVIVINLVLDVGYAIINPRVRKQ